MFSLIDEIIKQYVVLEIMVCVYIYIYNLQWCTGSCAVVEWCNGSVVV